MKNLVLATAVMIGLAMTTMASQAQSANRQAGDGTENFEFSVVKGDAELKRLGITREEANRKNPVAEKQWRKAWATKGQKGDTETYNRIRHETSPPAPSVPATPSSKPAP
jgi:hypothetical protein